jgi:hypothetical protein
MIHGEIIDRLYGSVGMNIALIEERIPEEYRNYIVESIRIMEEEGRNLEEVGIIKKMLSGERRKTELFF